MTSGKAAFCAGWSKPLPAGTRCLVAHRYCPPTVDLGALAEAVSEVLRDKTFSRQAGSNGFISGRDDLKPPPHPSP
ncbi:hypothetical protein [Rhodococcus indonesiensis]